MISVQDTELFVEQQQMIIFSKVYALDPAATKIKNYKNRIIPINATFEEFLKKMTIHMML